MKEVCVAFKTVREQLVLAVGEVFLGSRIKEIRKDGVDVIVETEDDTRRVFVDPELVWYVNDEPVKLEVVQ